MLNEGLAHIVSRARKNCGKLIVKFAWSELLNFAGINTVKQLEESIANLLGGRDRVAYNFHTCILTSCIYNEDSF